MIENIGAEFTCAAGRWFAEWRMYDIPIGEAEVADWYTRTAVRRPYSVVFVCCCCGADYARIQVLDCPYWMADCRPCPKCGPGSIMRWEPGYWLAPPYEVLKHEILVAQTLIEATGSPVSYDTHLITGGNAWQRDRPSRGSKFSFSARPARAKHLASVLSSKLASKRLPSSQSPECSQSGT